MIAARNARLEIKWQKPTSGFTPEAVLICFSVSRRRWPHLFFSFSQALAARCCLHD